MSGFVKRQADHGGVGADDRNNESRCKALSSVPAGFALPFAAGDVSLDFIGGQTLERNASFGEPIAHTAIGRDHCDAGIDPMRTGREKGQAVARLVIGLRFRQNATPDRNNRVGAENDSAVDARGLRFRSRET